MTCPSALLSKTQALDSCRLETRICFPTKPLSFSHALVEVLFDAKNGKNYNRQNIVTRNRPGTIFMVWRLFLLEDLFLYLWFFPQNAKLKGATYRQTFVDKIFKIFKSFSVSGYFCTAPVHYLNQICVQSDNRICKQGF